MLNLYMHNFMVRFIGDVFIDGELFTHPNMLMGAADYTCNKVLKQLRENVRELLIPDYIKCHKVEFIVKDLTTDKVEFFRFFLN